MSDMSGTIDTLLRDHLHEFPPSLWGILKDRMLAAFDAGVASAALAADEAEAKASEPTRMTGRPPKDVA